MLKKMVLTYNVAPQSFFLRLTQKSVAKKSLGALAILCVRNGALSARKIVPNYLAAPGILYVKPHNHPFFDQLPQADIDSVLHFAQRQCRFMDAFTHVLSRFARQALDAPALIARLVAWGTNMGLARMGQISDIGLHPLISTSDNFLRPETLREANDIVSNAIARLPIFHHYDIGDVAVIPGKPSSPVITVSSVLAFRKHRCENAPPDLNDLLFS